MPLTVTGRSNNPASAYVNQLPLVHLCAHLLDLTESTKRAIYHPRSGRRNVLCPAGGRERACEQRFAVVEAADIADIAAAATCIMHTAHPFVRCLHPPSFSPSCTSSLCASHHSPRGKTRAVVALTGEPPYGNLIRAVSSTVRVASARLTLTTVVAVIRINVCARLCARPE